MYVICIISYILITSYKKESVKKIIRERVYYGIKGEKEFLITRKVGFGAHLDSEVRLPTFPSSLTTGQALMTRSASGLRANMLYVISRLLRKS